MNKRGRKPKQPSNQLEVNASMTIDQTQEEEVKEVHKEPKEFNHTTQLPKSTVVRIITEKLQGDGLKLA